MCHWRRKKLKCVIRSGATNCVNGPGGLFKVQHGSSSSGSNGMEAREEIGPVSAEPCSKTPCSKVRAAIPNPRET